MSTTPSRPSDRTRPRSQPYLSLLACVRARHYRGTDLCLSGRGSVRPGEGPPIRLRKRCCSTPTGSVLPGHRIAAETPRGDQASNAATALKSVVADPSAYDWEGDAPPRSAVREDDHLRDARRRLHPAPELRRRGVQTRHVCRTDRENPLSAGSRHQRRRTAARSSRSTSRTRRRACATTGAISRSRSSRRTRRTARDRTRWARSTSFATWSRRCIAPASR